jgi:hypothetical protein
MEEKRGKRKTSATTTSTKKLCCSVPLALLCFAFFFSKKYGKISFVSSARFVVRFALTLHSRTNTTGRAPHSRVLSNFPLSLRSRAASLFFAAGDDCVSEAVLRVCAQLHATFIWSTVLLSFSLLLFAYVLSSVGPEQRARDWDALSAACVCVCVSDWLWRALFDCSIVFRLFRLAEPQSSSAWAASGQAERTSTGRSATKLARGTRTQTRSGRHT